MNHILHIISSINGNGSLSTSISTKVVEKLKHEMPSCVTMRNTNHTLPLVDSRWAAANFTPEEERSGEDQQTLALSDELVDELQAADTLVIGLPMYNFTVPIGFKSWIDLVARARKTFRYSETGPEGLLKNKKAYLIATSGGTPIGGDMDFASKYAKQMLNFMGITDVTILAPGPNGQTEEEIIASIV